MVRSSTWDSSSYTNWRISCVSAEGRAKGVDAVGWGWVDCCGKGVGEDEDVSAAAAFAALMMSLPVGMKGREIELSVLVVASV